MTRNRYSHIKTFKDFENEKIQLHYQIRLSEKKLEIKQLELREYLNPFKFFSSMVNELYKPVFDLFKSIIMHFLEKHKVKTNSSDQNKGTTD